MFPERLTLKMLFFFFLSFLHNNVVAVSFPSPFPVQGENVESANPGVLPFPKTCSPFFSEGELLNKRATSPFDDLFPRI